MTFHATPVGAALSVALLAGSVAFLAAKRPPPPFVPNWIGEGYSSSETTFLGNEHVFSLIGFNDLGHICGSGAGQGGRFVTHLFDGKSTQELSCPAGYIGSRAYGLNNHDVVVGSCYKKGLSYSLRPTKACFWDKSGVRELSPLPGLPCSRAWAINDDGVIVGVSYEPENEVRNAKMLPTAWVKELPVALALPPGATQGEARKVNEKGEIIGTATNAAGVSLACSWTLKSVRVLPPLDGCRSSVAIALNDSGVVAGLSDGRAVIWTDGVPKPLGEFPGAPSLSPVGIDNAGDVLINDQASPVNDVDDDPALPLLYRPGKGFVRISHLIASGKPYLLTKGLSISTNGQMAVGANIEGKRASILKITPPDIKR